MSLVSKIFSRTEQEKLAYKFSKPLAIEDKSLFEADTLVAMNGDLLELLSKQHRHLNKHQKGIEASSLSNAADYRATATLVADFKQNFEAHILLEQVEFYNHLEKLLSDSEPSKTANKNLAMLKTSRKSLNGVVNRVLRYCNRYKNASSIRHGKDEFHQDSADIRKLLKQRSRIEERELFPIYEQLH